ncbi:alginate lyase family protein [Rubinisphaera italica]|uniref:alginate lyase family protein n=1 Tax=Rubinisphaera italica TaxID=2527969 RepID=UPI0013EF3E2E|nr:alginate lyase family protein [Rubinisphaera italica]
MDGNDSNTIKQADRLISGVNRYFGFHEIKSSWPPDWHENPWTGMRVDSDSHWCEISDFEHGDIKVLWEPSRFSSAFLLVRAYWRKPDESYAQAFWDSVEDWKCSNRPQAGIHWKCGQEISLRVLAWCFGLYGFANSLSSTPERIASLLKMIAISGQRIAATIDYALSQKNNHGVSEAAALWTIGLLFPELKMASPWKNMGRIYLEKQAQELIYADGTFSQHSMNYHRVMLHLYLWCWRLGELHEERLTDSLRERIHLAGNFLYQVQDQQSGQVPCYGQNDGALVFPLSECDYQDYRPIVQAAHGICDHRRCFENGPWDEELLWLGGASSLNSEIIEGQKQRYSAVEGGYHVIRTSESFAMTRAGKFRHRPSQADMLHFDLWWRGKNIAIDPGTYSYNSPAPWDKQLGLTCNHNAVTVDGNDQMEKVSRFFWYPWVTGQQEHRQSSPGQLLDWWEGSHDGYFRLKDPVSCRRGLLRLGEEHWLVIDKLSGRQSHEYCLHWQLCDAPYELDAASGMLKLELESGGYQMKIIASGDMQCSLVRADPQSTRGWHSAYYLHRVPNLSINATVNTHAVTYWTLFGPSESQMSFNNNELQISSPDWAADIRLGDAGRLINHVSMNGNISDEMEIE